MLRELRSYWRQYRPQRYLFEGKPEVSYSATSVQKVLKRTIERARVNKPATVHTLRHSFATHLLEKGVDIRHIQRLLAHKSITTISIYVHLTDAGLSGISSPRDSLVT